LRKDVSLLDRSRPSATTQEDNKILMSPMATTDKEAIGSMGPIRRFSAMSAEIEAALHFT